MTQDHRYCDDLFARAEAAIQTGDPAAAERWQAFGEALLLHFSQEENVLFPGFEAQRGPMGPTMVMRQEHAMMRDMLNTVSERIASGDTDAALDAADALMATIQQHNMKEESILYPMLDQTVTGPVALTLSCRQTEAG